MALVLILLVHVATTLAARWSHTTMLADPDYRLLWSLGPGQDITFELQVRTLGYVGFGFSQDGRMAGADMIVGWVDQGQVYFQDRHVKDSPKSSLDREPEVDPSQDYQLLLGYENGTHTVLRFRRKLDTCDHHDIPITNDTMRVVWAYHAEEPHGGSVGPKSLPRHEATKRGSQSLYLVQRADQEPPGAEEPTRIWELKNEAVDLPPPGETLYWCHVFRIPVLTKKHHLIRYEPLRPAVGSSGLQQVLLYECQDNDQNPKMTETVRRQCFDTGTQPFACNTIVASWARGSEGFSFPPETGYPLEPSTSRFYLMETHYTTPIDGIVGTGSLEGSGLRLYYTPELRRHDAGVLSIGIDPNWRHIIPPGQQRVVSSGHCVADCTRQAFPHSGINMFAVVMKTHRIGKKAVLKHIRSNIEQPPIASDENLDADYQEYRKLGMPVRVLPGDHLIAECTYNSSGRSAITLGGLTNREETCLVMALYYPKQKALAACHSLPSLPTVLHSLGIQELSPGSNPVKIAAPPNLAGMTLESRLVSYDWNNQFDAFQDATRKGSFKPLCWTTQSTFLPGTDRELHYPNISKSYVRQAGNQCSRRRYDATTPPFDIDANRIEGVVRTKVSRSSSQALEESLGLSRTNAASLTCATTTASYWLLAVTFVLFYQ